jgi:hypothetical protein
MEKKKLSLIDLEVKSFTTGPEKIKGGFTVGGFCNPTLTCFIQVCTGPQDCR